MVDPGKTDIWPTKTSDTRVGTTASRPQKMSSIIINKV